MNRTKLFLTVTVASALLIALSAVSWHSFFSLRLWWFLFVLFAFGASALLLTLLRVGGVDADSPSPGDQTNEGE